MAEGISIPPWLQTSPYQAADNYVKGVQIGASIAQQRNALQQQAQESAMAAATKQQQLQQSAALDQQQIELSKAKMDAEMGIKNQELAQAQQQIQLKTQQAAQEFQQHMMFQSTVKQLMAADPTMDEGKASIIATMRGGTGKFVSGQGMAALGRDYNQITAPSNLQPQFFKSPAGAEIAMGPKGHILRTDTGTAKSGAPDYWTKFDATQLTKELSGLQKAQAEDTGGATAKNETMRKAYSDRAARIQQIKQQIQGLRGTGPTIPDSVKSASTASTGSKFVFNPKTGKIEPVTETPSPDEETDTEE